MSSELSQAIDSSSSLSSSIPSTFEPTPNGSISSRSTPTKIPISTDPRGDRVAPAAAEEGPRPFFSIIIPAYNEEDSIEPTCDEIVRVFAEERIDDYEILVVLDASTDNTEAVLRRIAAREPHVRWIPQRPERGFGYGVRCGFENFRGECACIVMADLSDAPEDIVRYYRLMRDGHECVFGSRFLPESKRREYPKNKLLLNRLANNFVRLLFRSDYNDFTNAFKCYRRSVIEGVMPLVSRRFNVTVELPLKAITRGYQYVVVPISWTNRAAGESKFNVSAMGSRYLMTVAQVQLEKWLSRNDYVRSRPAT